MDGVRAITFDCYGTLIDWEGGILRAIRPILAVHGVRTDDAEILRRYAQFEAEEERGEYRPYRDVLAGVMNRFAARFGLVLADRERDRLAESIARWEPFSDSVSALRRLAARYRLVICSNIDDDLFEASATRLGHTEDSPLFERVVTAQYCRSYKPDPRHFRVALALLDLAPGRVLHAAQSLYHDIPVAKAMGMPTAWVNRASILPDRGVVPDGVSPASPDLTVPDLGTLAARLGV